MLVLARLLSKPVITAQVVGTLTVCDGKPFINAQPRFGIYRDWRAETQTIYFDKIMFWNADPAGHKDWVQ